MCIYRSVPFKRPNVIECVRCEIAVVQSQLSKLSKGTEYEGWNVTQDDVTVMMHWNFTEEEFSFRRDKILKE